ncbi:unnamed protein product [Symbiodinium natans]|uniref:Uncharacterized protein n=1 Tax=Symbiodinium natans TaxID=878477 RepID=A0A812TCJ7_9DINO|nr:unnamed protein product [Symbiodinium natans]
MKEFEQCAEEHLLPSEKILGRMVQGFRDVELSPKLSDVRSADAAIWLIGHTLTDGVLGHLWAVTRGLMDMAEDVVSDVAQYFGGLPAGCNDERPAGGAGLGCAETTGATSASCCSEPSLKS